MAIQLPNSVASSQDLTALILEVHEYAKWFSHAVVKMHVNGSQIPKPPGVSTATSELIHAWGAKQQLNQKSLDELIAELEACRESAQTMTITLAAPAPGELKETLVAWCRKNIAPGVLVNFAFNGTLLGGMVVRHGSHVFDWSFRRQILAERGKFPGILRNV